MAQALLTLEETRDRVEEGRPLLLAGDERVLRQLPPGNWIGGTIPYFMSERGGVYSQDHVFVTGFPDDIAASRITSYDEAQLYKIYSDIPDNGFGVVILPAASPVLSRFAVEALSYKAFATSPLIGWVSGVPLAEIGVVKPLVFDGHSGAAYENVGVVLHINLPAGRRAEIGIVNPFHPGPGDALQFLEQGFSVGKALVNGRSVAFSAYLKENGINLQLPMVAEQGGSAVNVSFQGIDESSGRVSFLAPVFPGVTYRMARPIGDYVAAFEDEVTSAGLETGPVVVSCNCVLNYLYSGLEGRQTEQFVGPITFGEVAHQLLNQTMVYLSVKNAIA